MYAGIWKMFRNVFPGIAREPVDTQLEIDRVGCAEAPEACCRLPKREHRSVTVHHKTNASASTPADIHSFVFIPGGTALVGTDRPLLRVDGEGPLRRIKLRPFWMDRFAVTNAQFSLFVEQSGYVTDAERFGWSFVFVALLKNHVPTICVAGAEWWRRVDGASWRSPEGPSSSVNERPNHPVVHVSWTDACAYASWASARLPTEAEWETAARGGLGDVRYPWGDDEPHERDDALCNIWQGDFPYRNERKDGELGPRPVGAHPPNGYGLFNMVGNTWEWSADRFRVRSLSRQARIYSKEARMQNQRILKGGSYLCHHSYCHRYRIAARSGVTPDSTTGHIGFRLARNASPASLQLT
jgi:formylglycine-generating enzyme